MDKFESDLYALLEVQVAVVKETIKKQTLDTMVADFIEKWSTMEADEEKMEYLNKQLKMASDAISMMERLKKLKGEK